MARKPNQIADTELKATRLTNVNLSTVAARDKLKVRESPYWQKLDKGCQLGLRKMTAGSEIWWAKYTAPGTTKTLKEGLGEFGNLPRNERFGAAKKAAEEWFETVGRIGRPKELTVKEACAAYAKHKREADGHDAAVDVEGRFERWVNNAPVGKIALAKLTSSHLDAWRKFMEQQPAKINRDARETPLTRPRSMHTANRDMTALRAALNHAKSEKLVATDDAWAEALKPIKKQKPREDDEDAEATEEDARLGHHNIELTLDQRGALVAATDAEIRPFIQAMSLLPVRPGALARLKVRQLDSRNSLLTIGRDKAGSGRTLPLPETTLKVFEAAAEGKPRSAYLFQRANGKRWDKDSWKGPVKDAVRAAGLPDEATIYTVRHSVITDLVIGGLDLATVAKLAGTSLLMIDRHYHKLVKSRATSALSALLIATPLPPSGPPHVDFDDAHLI
nr:tyrosine-type recombinase/integrase [Variovorax boronicumulans]